MAGMLSLSACAGAPPADDPPVVVRFVPPADDGMRAGAGAPARVRRDAYGRPIYFREQRLDQHGVMRDVGPREGRDVRGRAADCDGQGRCRGGDCPR